MSHLAEIRRWVARGDYESIGALLDKNRNLDELDVQYLNQHVPQEKKRAWNEFVENGITIDVSTSQDPIDRERGVMVEVGRSIGGVWGRKSWHDVRITVETFQPTPFGNKVSCSIIKGGDIDVDLYQSFDMVVPYHQKYHKLWLYHRQTFKFDL